MDENQTIAEKLTELSVDIHEMCRRFEEREGVVVIGVIEPKDARIWIIPDTDKEDDNCFLSLGAK